MKQGRSFKHKSGFAALVAGVVAVSVPAVSHSIDPDVDQPGAAGNRRRVP
jgi:hypothetical protein